MTHRWEDGSWRGCRGAWNQVREGLEDHMSTLLDHGTLPKVIEQGTAKVILILRQITKNEEKLRCGKFHLALQGKQDSENSVIF